MADLVSIEIILTVNKGKIRAMEMGDCQDLINELHTRAEGACVDFNMALAEIADDIEDKFRRRADNVLPFPEAKQ